MRLPYTEKLLDIACAQRLPVSGTFELTSRCNLDCKMCYIHKRENDFAAVKAEKDTQWWLQLLRQVCDAGAFTLLLTGGEPFLRPDFCEIYTACKKAGLLVSVNTNASLLTEDILDALAKYLPLRVNVSLYGMSDKTYFDLCGQNGVFTRVTENLRRMKQRGIPLRINYTVTSHNIDDAEALLAFSEELDIPIHAATYTFPAVRCAEFGSCENERCEPEIAALYQRRWERLANTEEWNRTQKDKALKALSQTTCEEDTSRCRGGLSSWWASWDGKLFACSMLNRMYVPLDGRPFAEAWEEVKAQAKQMVLPPQCRTCPKKPFCEVCAAGCFAENSCFTEAPEYLCRKTTEYLQILSRE